MSRNQTERSRKVRIRPAPARPRTWTKFSVSSNGSGFSSVFEDPRSPRSPRTSVSKVFSVDAMMKYNSNHVIRYGTTRSMPEHHHRNHDHRAITNGYASTGYSSPHGKRLYSSNNQNKTQTSRRLVSNNSHFKRTVLERKEDAVSFFDIEMDKSPYYQYRPGEHISGAIHLAIRRNIEIRFVELIIAGEGTITVLKPKQGLPTTVKENYLQKQTFAIGTGDSAWSSVLTPGHYVSKFRFRLPGDLPSSIKHDDLSSGFTMDINYHIKARICDDVGSSSTRSTSSTNQFVKVLLSKRQPFSVQRHFDINLIPDHSASVVHTEEIYLSCAGQNEVIVTLSLDRAVFLAGDDIKLQLAVAMPHSQRIKMISCRLEQHLKLERQTDVTTFTLSNVERTDPQASGQTEDEMSYDVTIPTQTNLVTSFLQGVSMVRISYTLAIDIKFVPAGGKLSFTVPLAIGPCAEPIYAEKISSRKAVPIFNRPTRFPCFSPVPGKNPLQVDRSSRSSQSINVLTKYTNSFWGRCFMCCFASSSVQ